ncbi:MAG: MCP four helix bundle domain-containing protein, partial [Planctomycetota bacterium]
MRLTIAKRLTLGFAALVAVILVIGGTSWSSFRATNSSIDQLVETSNSLAEGTNLLQSSLTARANAIKYRVTLNDADADTFYRWIDEANASIDRSVAMLDHPETVAAVESVRVLLADYAAGFEQVHARLAERHETINQTLHPMNVRVRREMGELADSARGIEPATYSKIQQAIRSYYDGLVSVKFYFAMGDPEDVVNAAARLTSARDDLAEAAHDDLPPELTQRLEQAVTDIDTAMVIFGQVNQLQVEANQISADVLDTLGPQIVAGITTMKDELVALADQKKHEASASIASSSMFITGLALAAVAGSIVLAFFLTRSIVRPISMVNASLRDIAEGEGDLT